MTIPLVAISYLAIRFNKLFKRTWCTFVPLSEITGSRACSRMRVGNNTIHTIPISGTYEHDWSF